MIFKKLLLLSILIVSVFTQTEAQKKVNPSEIDQHNGLYFQRNHMEPFQGIAYEEYANGKKKTYIPIKKGKIEGTAREWAVDGSPKSEISYANGKKHGKEIQWYRSGNKKLEVDYQMGKEHGQYQEWYRSGKLKGEGQYLNGFEHAEHKWYFENGQIHQLVPFNNGQVEGTAKTWHLNGEVQAETNYSNGVMNGIRKEWYQDGQLKSVYGFENDQQHGEGKEWNKKGRLVEISTYKNGKLIHSENYRSGSVRTLLGITQVINTENHHLRIDINADNITELNITDMVYLADSVLLQIFVKPRDDNFRSLDAFIDAEVTDIQKANEEVLKVERGIDMAESGQPIAYWHYKVPTPADNIPAQRRIIAEHYSTTWTDGYIVNVYAIQTSMNNAASIKRIITSITKSVRQNENPLNLETITHDNGKR